MKAFFMLTLACFGFISHADSNLFHCKGGDITLSFSKSSFVGKPTLHVERNDKTIHLQGESAIKMSRQHDGLLITARGDEDYVSFLIPKEDKEFSTIVKLNSYGRRSIREVPVSCKGQSVQF